MECKDNPQYVSSFPCGFRFQSGGLVKLIRTIPPTQGFRKQYQPAWYSEFHLCSRHWVHAKWLHWWRCHDLHLKKQRTKWLYIWPKVTKVVLHQYVANNYGNPPCNTLMSQAWYFNKADCLNAPWSLPWCPWNIFRGRRYLQYLHKPYMKKL